MPLDLVMDIPPDHEAENESYGDYVREMRDTAEQAYEIAPKHLDVAAERRKATYDIRVKKMEFAVGDWVWYWYPRRYQRKSLKWQKNYIGPYMIVRVIEPGNYVL